MAQVHSECECAVVITGKENQREDHYQDYLITTTKDLSYDLFNAPFFTLTPGNLNVASTFTKHLI